MADLSTTTQAILLLTSDFLKNKNVDISPLTPTEWGYFALWLHDNNLKPQDLLTPTFEEKLVNWNDKKITLTRLKKLLNRGGALALALEKWQQVGIWVITRSDPEYPKQLKKRLKRLAPPLLYGIGNRKILNTQSIAVVGTREASNEDTTYAFNLGKKVATDGYTLVSGGAKGIDDAAMKGALCFGGYGIGVLSQNLLKATLSSQYRDALLEENLVLISPYYPEANFNVGNAMARNKYIYTLAEAAVVVNSNTSGGTWSGANEVIKNKWITLWVQEKHDVQSGNYKLIKLGANNFNTEVLLEDISILKKPIIKQKDKTHTTSLFDIPYEDITSTATSPEYMLKDISTDLTLFDLFIAKLKMEYTGDNIIKPSEVEKIFSLKKGQVEAWLLEAVNKKLLIKIEGRTKKYQLNLE